MILPAVTVITALGAAYGDSAVHQAVWTIVLIYAGMLTADLTRLRRNRPGPYLTGALNRLAQELLRLRGRTRISTGQPYDRPARPPRGDTAPFRLSDALDPEEALLIVSRRIKALLSADGCVIAAASPEGTMLVGDLDPRSVSGRFRREFIRLYSEYFQRGDESALGFRDGLEGPGFFGDFSLFGFRYTCALPFADGAERSLAWIGMRTAAELPQRIEAEFAQALEAAAHEVGRMRRVRELSHLVCRAETESRRKSDLFAFASHDMRSPLMNIRAVLGMLQIEGMTADSPRHIDAALRSVEEVDDLVGAVIDFTRHQAGALSAERSAVSVSKLFERIEAVFIDEAYRRGLQLVIEHPDDEIYLDADPRQLRRILSNLVGNALKYTPFGRISVCADLTQDRAVTIEVADTGLGISEDCLERIFVPFNRFHAETAEGVGLGMVLSKVFTELNGGSIEVSSQQGVGTVVRATFLRALIGHGSVSSINVERSREGSVLIVEDDEDAARSLARLFESEGIRTRIARSATEALLNLRSHSIDLMVCDRHFPGGIMQLVSESQRDGFCPKVIVFSGESAADDDAALRALGVSHFLQKPAEIDDLLRTVRAEGVPGLRNAA